MLSENTIKKSSLRFLKTYYKYRERKGETVARYDMTTKTGIIADGHLSFLMEDGRQFLATFEATALSTRGEVVFRKQNKTLIWDSLALASMIAACVFAYGYFYDQFTVQQLGLSTCLMILASVFLFALSAFLLIFNQASRYRYIYAIEQFKKYYADEQWIAIGSDVFKRADDKAFKELKKQCVYGGFGLISVGMDERAHLLITPSREQVLSNRRKRLFFTEQEEESMSPVRKRMFGFWKPIRNFFAKLFQWRVSSNSLLLRYRRPIFRQVLLFSASLTLISFIFYQEIKEASPNYVNEAQYQKKMMQLGENAQPESKEYLRDSTNITNLQISPGYHHELYNREKERKSQAYTTTVDDSSDTPIFETGELLEMQADPNGEVQIYINDNGTAINQYDCARFFNFRTTVYLVEDAIFTTVAAAKARMELLQAKAIDAHILWLGCFSESEQSYIVYIDLFFEQEAEARQLAQQHRNQLKTKGIEAKNLKIRSIPPSTR